MSIPRIPILSAASILLFPFSTQAATVFESYTIHATDAATGAILNGYVSFDPALMSWTGSRYYIRFNMIEEFNFEISGHTSSAINGFYDVLLGGALFFNSPTVGQSVPVTANSLVLYHAGNTGIIFQGVDTPAGRFNRFETDHFINFDGTWTYQAVPEPGVTSALAALAPAILWRRRRTA